MKAQTIAAIVLAAYAALSPVKVSTAQQHLAKPYHFDGEARKPTPYFFKGEYKRHVADGSMEKIGCIEAANKNIKWPGTFLFNEQFLHITFADNGTCVVYQREKWDSYETHFMQILNGSSRASLSIYAKKNDPYSPDNIFMNNKVTYLGVNFLFGSGPKEGEKDFGIKQRVYQTFHKYRQVLNIEGLEAAIIRKDPSTYGKSMEDIKKDREERKASEDRKKYEGIKKQEEEKKRILDFLNKF